MNAAQLNQVAQMIEAQTGAAPTKEVVFSACILSLTQAGMDIKAAFDFVLGEGRFSEFASNLHNQLTA